jgi:hypothetical protein
MKLNKDVKKYCHSKTISLIFIRLISIKEGRVYMSKIVEQLKKIINSLKMSLERFPEIAFISIVIAVIGIALNHESTFNQDTVETLGKAILTLIIILPLASYGKLIYEKKTHFKWRIISDVIAVAIGLLFYFSIPDTFNEQFAIQSVSLFLSFTFGLTLVQHYKKENYSIYVLDLVSSFFITILFSLVLYLGIISMIFTIEQLFELSIDNKLYLDVFILIASLFSVTYFFARLPKADDEMEIFMYPNVLKGLINYIIIPLIIVYTGILYLYFGRIVMLQTFPINLLSHLVMWYALISVIVLFFINRIKDQNKILDHFYSYFPIAILVPLIMLFLAIGKRIADYSVTPLRYYVLIIGIWATFSVLYIKFSKKFKSNFIVIAAIFFMLISLYGPQSAFTLSRNLQEDRFIKVLESNEMIENNQIISKPDLADDAKEEINDFIRYFSNYHDFEEIEILPDDFNLNDMETVFGFEHYYYAPSMEVINYNYMDRNIVINVSDYDYFAQVDLNLENSKEYILEDFSINYVSDKNSLTFNKEGKELAEINIVDMIEAFDERHNGSQIDTLEDATIEYSMNDTDIKIIIGNIYYQKSNDNDIKPYSNIRFQVLIK